MQILALKSVGEVNGIEIFEGNMCQKNYAEVEKSKNFEECTFKLGPGENRIKYLDNSETCFTLLGK
jgi:hypothetical protein